MAGFIDIHAVCVRELMAPVGGRHDICDVQRQIALYDRIGVEKGVISSRRILIVSWPSATSIRATCTTAPTRRWAT